jgi:hypothetical protein
MYSLVFSILFCICLVHFLGVILLPYSKIIRSRLHARLTPMRTIVLGFCGLDNVYFCRFFVPIFFDKSFVVLISWTCA